MKFKKKLAIGEDAYASLRLKKNVIEAWDIFGAGATAVSVAQSSAIASTFFAPGGLLAAVGIGTAVTPIGWVISAGVLSAGAWVGISRYLKNQTNTRVTIIPEFINTPLDILGLTLFDFIAPLALKIANIDGKIEPSERLVIRTYFVNEWGFDSGFVEKSLLYTETKLSDFSIKDIATALAEFKKSNPDCNYSVMSKDILSFLTDIMQSDGIIDEREEMAINLVDSIFTEVGKINITKNIKEGINVAKDKVGDILTNGMLPFKK